MRYLTNLDVRTNLAAGREVEQLLPERHEMNQLVIRYISIEKNRSGGWKVRFCEVFDGGNPEFIDVYEFEALDPDLPFGDEWVFDSIEGAMSFAEEKFGAANDRYVNRGLIQDEYKDRYHPEW
ncbi:MULTISPECIES: hypothetical protein [Xanthomonas]|uniref:hypothetical protein n=1 Tax=Xanthomonas TaxID=338 RepID=UPI0012636E22|nr:MULTISPECIES: hypothetical protein [Xanthomonas]MCW0457417.1 hypothetical protein [Xanthomonas sacchari]